MARQWEPRKFSPTQYRICYMAWSGMSADEIAERTDYNVQHVRKIITSEIGQQIMTELHERSLDTIAEVEIAAQAVAPAVFEEKTRLALMANDERVRNAACSDVLAIAGHQPVKRISIEKANPAAERLGKLSDEEIRAEIRAALTPTSATVH